MNKVKKENYLELVIFLAHYHSGQWSRGYRLLCLLFHPERGDHFTSEMEREVEQTEIYQYLVKNYADKV